MLQKHMKFNAWGSGIGLSISKMIVENLGGKISVASEEGEWSEFEFTIKCKINSFINKEETKENRVHLNEQSNPVMLIFYYFKCLKYKIKCLFSKKLSFIRYP